MRFRFALCTLALAPAAIAVAGFSFAPIHLEYVDNGGVSDESGANLAQSVTYDMYAHNQTGQDIIGVVGFDFGSQSDASPPYFGIPVAGAVFNHEFGGDTVPQESLFPAFPALRYDAYWSVGLEPVALEPDSVDLVGSDGFLNGRFRLDAGSYDIADGAYLRFGRITFLTGNFDYFRPFAFDAILEDGSRVRFGIPAPGAWAALTLASCLAARGRRR